MERSNEKDRSAQRLGPTFVNALPFSGVVQSSEKHVVSNNPVRRSSSEKRPTLIEQEQNILKWPTETFSIDYYDTKNRQECPHTVLLFIPGNPGCMGWYTDFIFSIVNQLGRGFAARGVSYAGHGVDSHIANVEQWEESDSSSDSFDKYNRDVKIPWSVDGQIMHKIAWMDHVAAEMQLLGQKQQASNERSFLSPAPSPRYIFISHSIGAHMVQRLSILRPDILQKTILQIHLMPYIRTDAPQPQKTQMSVAANAQSVVIPVAQTLTRMKSCLPMTVSDFLMRGAVPDEKGRKLAAGIARQPHFARNFFELGLEEVRDVPERPDVSFLFRKDSALRLIGKHCAVHMLYCGGPDHWAPTFHMDDLQQLRDRGCIPESVNWTYMPELLHGFVVFPEMVPKVAKFCFRTICKVRGSMNLKSRL